MGTPANALDITQAGLVKFDGVNVFSAVTTTNHSTLVGATSNGITSVGPSATAGQILRSNGSSADPSYSTAAYPNTAGTSGNLLVSDGTNFNSTFPSNYVQNLAGATVNLKTVASTTSFVTGNSPFFAVSFVFRNIALTGTPGTAVLNVGWTPSNYIDLINTQNVSFSSQGQIFYDSAFQSNGGILIPANSTVVVKVTTGDATATTNTAQLSVIGYYY